MSSQRMIKDSFWTDSYIARLDPSEKLLFLYLLTNPLCNIAGIYEIQLRRIAFDTGFDVDMVEKLLCRLEKDDKILRKDEWILIINHAKHQAYKNDNVTKGISRIIEELPEKVKALKGFERLSHLTLLNLTLPNASKEAGGGIKKQKKDMSFQNMKRYKGEDGGYEDVSIQVDPDYKPKKKDTKKVSDDVQAVFDLFNNPASALWRMREIERVAAQTLFETYGLDKLRIRVKRIQEEAKKKDPLFPLISTPSQLLDKMPNVERYLEI